MSEIKLNLYSEPLYNRKEIYRYLGAPKPDGETVKLVEECLKECNGVCRLSVLHTVSDIRVNGDKIDFDTFSVISSDLSKNLSGCDRAVIFAATVGIGIDRLISKYAVVSPAKAVVFQAFGAERIESLCDMFNEEMRVKYVGLKPRSSPGYGDLPLETQKDIFSLLGCEKKTGLTLNNNLLMSPSKSVTAIIGINRK